MFTFWPKVIVGLLGFAAILALILVVMGWKADSEQLKLSEATVADLQSQLNDKEKEYVRIQTASAGYQQELADLRDYVSHRPAPVVRVCRTTPTKVLAPTATESGPDAGPSSAGILPQEPGPDIGPELRADAFLADGLSAQIRGLKSYITNVCLRNPDVP